MNNSAPYDVLSSFQDIHKIVLRLPEDLTDEQLCWRPAGYSTSIAFHLWHLARESDYLKAAILQHVPQIGPGFGEPEQIWQAENLAEKWGFPAELGASGVGTGIGDEAAASLPFPPKAELLDYLGRAYAALEAFVAAFDARYGSFDGLDADLQSVVARVRKNFLVFLLHDGRHLGMMECLKGLQTGFGSATEQRRAPG
jgi:hypothetical protein